MYQAHILEKFTVKCSPIHCQCSLRNKTYSSYLLDFKGKSDYFIIIHLKVKYEQRYYIKYTQSKLSHLPSYPFF